MASFYSRSLTLLSLLYSLSTHATTWQPPREIQAEYIAAANLTTKHMFEYMTSRVDMRELRTRAIREARLDGSVFRRNIPFQECLEHCRDHSLLHRLYLHQRMRVTFHGGVRPFKDQEITMLAKILLRVFPLTQGPMRINIEFHSANMTGASMSYGYKYVDGVRRSTIKVQLAYWEKNRTRETDFVHELGHHLDSELGGFRGAYSERAKWQRLHRNSRAVSEYASTKACEDFAESFVAFQFQDHHLYEVSHGKFRLFKQLFPGYRARVHTQVIKPSKARSNYRKRGSNRRCKR